MEKAPIEIKSEQKMAVTTTKEENKIDMMERVVEELIYESPLAPPLIQRRKKNYMRGKQHKRTQLNLNSHTSKIY